MKTKVLVTGASGFIGSHLVERLVEERYSVKAFIRKGGSDEVLENKKDSIELLKKLKVEIIKGDLLDINSLKEAIKGVNIVFHLAAIARPMPIPDELYFKVNVKGTKNLLNVCKDKKIKKIVIMSSVSSVGPSRDGNPVNEKTPCSPVDIYGESKLAQEKIAEKFIEKYKLPIIFLRPPMVFGERDFEMKKLFKAVNQRFFPISGNKKCMEFLYVKNLVEACLLVLKKGILYEKYHVTNGEHYSINEIINSIEKVYGKRVYPIKFPKVVFFIGGYLMELAGKFFGFHPPFKHDTIKWMTEKFWYSSSEKLEKLGYTPKFSLEEGIKRTAEYYKN